MALLREHFRFLTMSNASKKWDQTQWSSEETKTTSIFRPSVCYAHGQQFQIVLCSLTQGRAKHEVTASSLDPTTWRVSLAYWGCQLAVLRARRFDNSSKIQ